MRWRRRQRARRRGNGDVWSMQGAVDAHLTMVLPVTDSQGAIDKEQQCPKSPKKLLNNCDVHDIECMDDEGEGGCSNAPIMLDVKAKKSILEGEHSISWKRGQDNVQKVSPYPVKVLLNSKKS